jgi:cysteinyl-tRNA synthetase
LAQGHKGETLRLALLSAHYRQPLPWTEALIAQAKAILDRLYRASGESEASEVDEGVLEALRDDLNTPLALSRLSALEGRALKASANLLGLLQHSADEWFRGGVLTDVTLQATGVLTHTRESVDRLIAERAAAKKNRDFATADRIRDGLIAEGIVLEDGPNGTTWRRE